MSAAPTLAAADAVAAARDVVAAVAVVFGYPERTIYGRATSRDIAHARHLAMTIARDVTGLPFHAIALIFARTNAGAVNRAHADVRSLARVSPRVQGEIRRVHAELVGCR